MRLLGWMYFFFFFFPVIQYLLTVAGDSSVCNTFGAGVALSFRQSLDNEKKISKNVFREPPKKRKRQTTSYINSSLPLPSLAHTYYYDR